MPYHGPYGVPSAPVVTSATTASGTVGQPFTYAIIATQLPTSYNATSLPAGLTVNTNTGVISGTPTTAGVSHIAMTATNSHGTSPPVTLTLTVASSKNISKTKVTNLGPSRFIGYILPHGVTMANSAVLTVNGDLRSLQSMRKRYNSQPGSASIRTSIANHTIQLDTV